MSGWVYFYIYLFSLPFPNVDTFSRFYIKEPKEIISSPFHQCKFVLLTSLNSACCYGNGSVSHILQMCCKSKKGGGILRQNRGGGVTCSVKPGFLMLLKGLETEVGGGGQKEGSCPSFPLYDDICWLWNQRTNSMRPDSCFSAQMWINPSGSYLQGMFRTKPYTGSPLQLTLCFISFPPWHQTVVPRKEC